MPSPQLSFVIPLYNEEEIFRTLISRLNKLMASTELLIEIVLINDGSTDSTEVLMQQLALTDERYHCIFLARNFGHQMALSAGLSVAKATEAIMIIDGDLQDPPELVFEFYKQYQLGYDVVYAIRKTRKEGIYKKLAYAAFYRLIKQISSINMPLDSGDFSLLSRKIVNILNKMPEESRFIRGMRSWVGFNQIGIEYERQGRVAGNSKYSFSMLLRLAYNGIFNFSELPVKFITFSGMTAILLSLIYFVITVIRKFLYQDVPVGFTALIFSIILFGGVQLVSLGIIGEYVLRIFFQVKNRPLYIVKNRIENRQVIEVD